MAVITGWAPVELAVACLRLRAALRKMLAVSWGWAEAYRKEARSGCLSRVP